MAASLLIVFITGLGIGFGVGFSVGAATIRSKQARDNNE